MSIIEKAINKFEKEVGSKAAHISRKNKPRSKSKIDAVDETFTPESEIDEIEELDSFHANKIDVEEYPHEATHANYLDIDLNRLHQLGIVTPDQGKTQIAEQFRIIKRPLLTKAFTKKNNNLIMIF